MAMYNRVVSVITKPPSDRTESEILPLLPWFSKKSKLFENMKAEIMVDILRNCAFQMRNMDDVIIRQGEIGDCFYIILSGKVSVYINTDVVPDDPNESKALETDGPNDKKERLDRTKFGNYIVAFADGRSFGELALINKDCIRNASIIADERTDLVVIDRDLFNRCLRAAQEADLKARQDFVNNCSLFNGWVPRYKRQAVMSLRKEVLQFDSPIVRQGDSLDGLYFLIRGQARVVLDILMHITQYPHLKLDEQVLDENDSRTETEAQQALLRELLQQHTNANVNVNANVNANEEENAATSRKQSLWDRPRRRQGYAAAEQRLAKRNIEVSLITDGEIIGTVEQSMNLSTYAQSIICTQPTEVFILDAKNYERLVEKRNPRTLAMIRQSAEVKLLSPVVARSLYRTIPLIHCLVDSIEQEYKDKTKARRPATPSTDSVIKTFRQIDFIPQRGPIINEYGPGTVFFRNKQLREIREKQDRHKFTSGAELMRLTEKQQSNVTGNAKDTPRRKSTLTKSDFFFRNVAAEPQFEDWETSGKHLGELEQKMQEWHTFVEELEREREKEKTALPSIQRLLPLQMQALSARSLTATDMPTSNRFDKEKSTGVVPLRRLKIEKTSLVKPGAKVVLRKKSPGDDSDSNSDSDESVNDSKRGRNGRPRSGIVIRLDTPPPIASSNTSSLDFSRGGQSKVKENSKKKKKQHTLEQYQELKLKLKMKEREMTHLKKAVY